MKADEANRSQCTDPSMSRNGVLLEPTPRYRKVRGAAGKIEKNLTHSMLTVPSVRTSFR
jgi:hypothetical protein